MSKSQLLNKTQHWPLEDLVWTRAITLWPSTPTVHRVLSLMPAVQLNFLYQSSLGLWLTCHLPFAPLMWNLVLKTTKSRLNVLAPAWGIKNGSKGCRGKSLTTRLRFFAQLQVAGSSGMSLPGSGDSKQTVQVFLWNWGIVFTAMLCLPYFKEKNDSIFTVCGAQFTNWGVSSCL